MAHLIPRRPIINNFTHLGPRGIINDIHPYYLREGCLEAFLEAVSYTFGSAALTLMRRGELPPECEQFLERFQHGDRFYTFLSNLDANIAAGIVPYVGDEPADGA